MKIFLDTADRDIIKKWTETRIVDGVTTNPSLLSKQGDNTKQVLFDICKMVNGDVSIEVVEKDPQKVYEQAKEISKIAPNVVVKIPFAHEYLSVIAKLTKEKVAINATLIFSVIQALLVAKLNVKYISPFIGRLDDIDIDGMRLLQDLVQVKKSYDLKSEILAASIRNVMHWHYATLIGTDVITLPPKILDSVMNHPLTTQGIEKFDKDWQSFGKESLLD